MMPHSLSHSSHSSSAQCLEIVSISSRRRERHVLSIGYSWWFCLCLVIVLEIYIRKFLLGFLPHEGFPG
jgi:hypothetical protein